MTDNTQSYIYDSNSNTNDLFTSHCENGWLTTLKWLWKLKCNEIQISQHSEYNFRIACQNGHLAVAQCLLLIKPVIDIGACNEDAFCMASCEGHVGIVEWLWHLNPLRNITIKNDYSFRMACLNRHIDVAKLLCEIEPRRYKITEIIPSKYQNTRPHIKFQISWDLDIAGVVHHKVKEKEMCSICQEKWCDIETECKHAFCHSCIQIWINKDGASDSTSNNNTQTCPCCRQSIYTFNRIEYNG